jgi:hypothetical protein
MLSKKCQDLKNGRNSATQRYQLRLRMKANTIKLYQKKVTFWKTKFTGKKTSLTSAVKELRVVRNQSRSLSATHVKQLLSKHFTPRQIDILTSQKSKTHWAEEDISKALCLRAKSISAYEFVRTYWKIPLPSSATLKRWVTQIHFAPGLLQCVLSMLKVEFEDANELDR